MLVSDFDYVLPESLIAQHPPSERGTARMLALDRSTGAWEDRHFGDFPHLLRSGDVLVLNDSRVIPARLFARRRGDPQRDLSARQTPQGRIEVLLTEQQSPSEWRALVRPGKKVAVGERLVFSAPDDTAAASLSAEVIARGEFGERTLSFDPTEDFFELLDRLGHMPLPPYIHRSDEQEDRERYQTVFARTRGSVAAPTAGLHFTPQMLRRIEQAGVEIRYVTLHVGLGTFQPVRVERLDQIHLHTERYTLPQETAIAINAARLAGRRIVAAGTTTVRVLEHCATLSADGMLAPHSGNTQIFLAPGHHFRLVDALLTNFHLPQSTLLMLVSAFAGREHTLAAYRHAVEAQYRFFSYGDCMFIS
ncbi:MAG: tRNA preQ1(34) S-adenosylmethionine ribosyltransferase-isomerase QueA [Acidobacteriaceae bacterium]